MSTRNSRELRVTRKEQARMVEGYMHPEVIINAVDNAIKKIQIFSEQMRNNDVSRNLIAHTKESRDYATGMYYFQKVNEISGNKSSPLLNYFKAIYNLTSQPGLLQPPSSPEINLRDVPLNNIGSSIPGKKHDFWSNYSPLSNENKSKVNERVLAVLDMQATALQNLRLHLDTKHAPLQKMGLTHGYDAIEWRMRHINSNQMSLQTASQGLKEWATEQKVHMEHLVKMSAEAKALHPSKTQLFTSSLSHVRHKMSSVAKTMTHSTLAFFAKKSHADSKSTFVSYMKHSEQATPALENETSPTPLSIRP